MTIVIAGHADHGKTTLLQATTGVNADRLPEKKARGMTTDLGHAYWPQPDGRVPGFIDVFGYEKFLSNMLAGVGGTGHALLVVACDDGVMAQTREHLVILQLTGKPMLTVALTKTDRVAVARVGEVRTGAEQTLRELGSDAVAFFPTAATENIGIAELRSHLLQFAKRPHPWQQRLRLALDRAFTVKGAGLVVTGTAFSGEVRVGDTLWLTDVNTPMRVRGLHAQNQAVERVHAGQRIAPNIVGDAQKEAVYRGDWLLSSPPPGPAGRVAVELQCHTPPSQWQSLHIRHAASHVIGRVSLLEGNLAELMLDTPLWLADNDRLVLRDISARMTLTGARVVTLDPSCHGKCKSEYLQWPHALAAVGADDTPALELYLQWDAVRLERFARARQLSEAGMAVLIQRPDYLQAGQRLLNAPLVVRWQRKLLDAPARCHEQHRDESGPGQERLCHIALSMEDEALVLLLIEQMRESGLVHSHHGWLHLPEYKARLTDEQQAVWQKVETLFGDDLWWVRDLAREVYVGESLIRTVLRQAAQQGMITAIVKDRHYHNDRIVQFVQRVCELDQLCGSTCAADFRDTLNVGRKLAIQILEYFDRIGFIRHRGNDHILCDKTSFL